MNNLFKYTGVVCLVVFSFFYTEKAVNVTNSKDPIMQSIMSYESDNNIECSEGSESKDGVILGVSGFKVNINRSYGNMKGIGFDEELMVFDENKCEVTKEKVIDKYIINGNSIKNSVSLLVMVDSGSYLKRLVSIAEDKNIKLSFVVSGNVLESNRDFFRDKYSKGFDILYSGNDKSDLRKYNSIMKGIDKNGVKYCVYKEGYDVIELCKKEKINSIKSSYVIEKNILMNIKDYTSKGNFIVLKENENLVNELGASINFIKAKGIDIKTITEHLSEGM